jgi:hypothetical protein
MATITVKDAANADQTIERPLAPGSTTRAASRPVAFSTEDIALFAALGAVADAVVAAGAAGTIPAQLRRLTTDISALLAAIIAGFADTTATAVIPAMGSAGNLSLITNATGTTYTAFGSQACKQLTIENNTGTDIEVRYGAVGVAFPIPNGKAHTFYGLTNASNLDVRRIDTSNTQVTVKANWAA